MIAPFSLNAVPEIFFAANSLKHLAKHILKYGNNIVLVLGSSSFSISSHYQRLQEDFTTHGISYHIAQIPGEPSPEMINSIVKSYSSDKIDLVVAIGGGSSLDAGKAISAMLVEQEDVALFLEGVGSKNPSGRKLPFIAIPTTAGTGSEATANAVISSVGEAGFKKSLRHNNYVPDIALIDPTLTLSCPRELTVACAMDCFSQLVEGYLSLNGSSITDALALDGIKAIKRSLKTVCADAEENLAARSDLSYAALLSGIVLASAGLGTVHGFASVLGGLYPIPHGVACGTLMAPANTITLQRLREKNEPSVSLEKYSELGRIFSDQKRKESSWYQDYFIEELVALTEELCLPLLSTYGITSSDTENIITVTSNKYNPVNLHSEDLHWIISSRLA
ncbi:MAG: iron-containing alcohol dehydrogenase [Desulfobulbaceae bacterium]|nr:iron-containing alcohol dehydrogenase [Desulfobulbaceae bacterium]